MKFDKLRIVGFKTFVDPTDFLIERGLTGVVGPNGCGKSNLVEALRWVMGETSHKSMRASAMDDVIFNGSGGRPARNSAEVTLFIDNADRTAPAAVNDADRLEISRKLEREQGSTYRVNGREARARDVQILFADAASGARSPALVRQGQIGEIIAARPQARRRILEDAAGIAGLHARRHEADLRLKSAEENLLRTDDVLREIEAQAESLSRQARQAVRYREMGEALRRAEAVEHLVRVVEARGRLADLRKQHDLDVRQVAERTRLQGEAARAAAVAEHELQPLREAAVARAAALQRLQLAREEIDGEERRLRERAERLDRRLAELARDIERAGQLGEDASRSIAALDEENERLEREAARLTGGEPAVRARVAAAEAALATAESGLAEAQQRSSDLAARRAAGERAVRESAERLSRAETQAASAERELAALRQTSGGGDLDALRAETERRQLSLAEAETALQRREADLAGLRKREAETRARLSEAERAQSRLDGEARGLRKVLAAGGGDLWPPVLEAIRVRKGYEVALGAALGDDLEASDRDSAPAHWLHLPGGGDDPALPAQARPLAEVVDAPPAMARRLAQIGIVAKGEGAGLQRLLRPGQRLVTREGDLWRWDGLIVAAEAPSPAARRLAEKNRLAELEETLREATRVAEAARTAAQSDQASLRAAEAEEAGARQSLRTERQALDACRLQAAAAERREAETRARLGALEEMIVGLAGNRAEAAASAEAARQAFASLDPAAAHEATLAARRTEVVAARGEAMQAAAGLQYLSREVAGIAGRRDTIARERMAWSERSGRATAQIEEIAARRGESERERRQLADAPDDFIVRRRALTHEIAAAEEARKLTADAAAAAETAHAAADRAARQALGDLSAAREAMARSGATAEAAGVALAEVERQAGERLAVPVSELPGLAGLDDGVALPQLREAEERVAQLRRERERMGAVNLKADEELAEVQQRRGDLIAEKEDLDAAIRKFRRAIQNLNEEGRRRLLQSFEVVNGHFRQLFATLFGGGEAELQLVESDDPLEAGLEILAKPPGKRPQVLTLLSGGEQALTATALIFAVFLTNPSPICVLDEIDAPLDDHNVERLCDMLDDMARSTDTRFVLITHNPITMARMDRLFGVTMAERGVSQLVSVDLEGAERLAEAG
jgi:chromosome segregation protein